MVDVSVKINLKNGAADSDPKNLDGELKNKGKKDSLKKKMEVSNTEIADKEIVVTASKDDDITESPGKEEENKKKSNNSKVDLRDVGSDLDDLLNKISTIVDCADAKKKTENDKEKSPSKKPLTGDKTSDEKLSTVNKNAQSDGEDIYEDAFDTTPPLIEAISTQTSDVNNKYHDHDINDDEFDDLEAELEALDDIKDFNDEIQLLMDEEEECDDSDILLLDLGKDDESNENKKKDTQKTKSESERVESSSVQNEVEDNVNEEIVEIPDDDDEESNSKTTDIEIKKVDVDPANEKSISKTKSESIKSKKCKENLEKKSFLTGTLDAEKTKSIKNSIENGKTKVNVDGDANNIEEEKVQEMEEENKNQMKEKEIIKNSVKIPKKNTKLIPKVDDDVVDLVDSEEKSPTIKNSGKIPKKNTKLIPKVNDDVVDLVDSEEKSPTRSEECSTTPEDISMENLVVSSENDETTTNNSINIVPTEETTTSTEEKLDKKDDVIGDKEADKESSQAVENIKDEVSKESKKPSGKIVDEDVDDDTLNDKLEEIPTAIKAPILGGIPAKIDILVGDIPTTSNSNEAGEEDSDDDVMVINDDDDEDDDENNEKDTVEAEAEADMEVESTEVKQNTKTTNEDLNPIKSNSSEQQESNDDTTEILLIPADIKDDADDINEVIDSGNASCNDPKTSISKKLKQNDKKPTPSVNNSKETADSDDVLIIEDDDDDEPISKADTSQKFVVNEKGKETSSDEKATVDYSVSKLGQEEEGSVTTTTTKFTNDHENTSDETDLMIVDNSDNACDQFEKREEKTTDETEEINSNSNSSSNLLVARKRTSADEEDRCSESADVELIDNDSDGDIQKDKEPLPKRIRLSVGNELIPEESGAAQKMEIDDTSVSVDNINAKEIPSLNDLKRPHCSMDVDDDDDNDTKEPTNKKDRERKDVKKTKFEKTSSQAKQDELKKSGDIQDTTKVESKPQKSNKIDLFAEDDTDIPPVKLYPEPKISESFESIKFEYVRRFKKSFDKMTRNDLEEFMLLKVVEALQFKSEFAELKMQLHRQENSLKIYRTRVAELKKRFVDLEVIHNNLKKEVQEHNSKYIVPTKVTRSVALNVNLTTKKIMESTIAPASSTTVPSTPNISLLGQRAVHRGNQPSVSNMQRTTVPPLIATKRTSEPPIISTNNHSSSLRRGCIQKITPQRPMPHTSSASNNGGSRHSIATAHTSSHLKSPPKVLNKNAPVRPPPTISSASTSTAPALSTLTRPRQSLPVPSTDLQQDINKQRALAGKPVAKPTMRRSDVTPTTPTTVVNVPSSAFGNGSIPAASNLTSAKPKEKAVIDLTDEDETAEAAWRQQQAVQAQNRSAQISMPAQGTVPARQRPPGPSGTAIKRSPISFTPRLPQRAQQPTGAARQPAQNAVQRTPNNVNLPPGTNISRVIPTAQSTNPRPRFCHPAPLPPVPPQQYHPDWKLPPPRPLIRISIMENGIVISWTMEDLMERHADCVSYQIYAYQETRQLPSTDLWRHVGDVKAMLLPMAVTLNQFQENQRYYFAVRAVDEYKRYGPFSLPKTWP